MASYMFTKLLPKDVSFVRGESPSPDKLNGIFNQLSSAMFVLESFLGNGIDYRITDDGDRKMLFNLSSAIGRVDKLYKPTNRLPDLRRIFKKYGGVYGTWDSINKTLEFTGPVMTPANLEPGDKLAMYYTGEPVINVNGTDYPLAAKAEFGWSTLNITDSVDYIITAPASGQSLVVKSFYISDTFDDDECYNTGYSLPLANATYYSVKTPCVYSSPSASGNANICANKTCNYCIGNTYNYDLNDSISYGSPICSGARNLDNELITYTAEVGNLRATYLTLQCPLNTTENSYALKYRPFSMHSNIVDSQIMLNQCMIYDIKDAVSPVKYNTYLYSAGGVDGNVRGDIFYVTDNLTIQAGDNKRYIVLGGSYGMIDLLYDMIQFVEKPIPPVLSSAVYDI